MDNYSFLNALCRKYENKLKCSLRDHPNELYIMSVYKEKPAVHHTPKRKEVPHSADKRPNKVLNKAHVQELIDRV